MCVYISVYICTHISKLLTPKVERSAFLRVCFCQIRLSHTAINYDLCTILFIPFMVTLLTDVVVLLNQHLRPCGYVLVLTISLYELLFF